jgi:DNA-binding protein H-NS
MTDTLSSVLSLVKSKAAEAVADYRELVEDLAAERQIAPERTEEVLSACGISPDQLAADVGKLRRIKELQLLVAELPALEEKRREENKRRAAEIQREEHDFNTFLETRRRRHAEFLHADRLRQAEITKAQQAQEELAKLTELNLRGGA